MSDRVPVRVAQIEEYTPTNNEGPGIMRDVLDEGLTMKMLEIVGEDNTTENSERAQKILDYIRSHGAESPEQTMWEFRSMMRNLAAPRVGDNRLNMIFRYITLDKVVDEAKGEMMEMEV